MTTLDPHACAVLSAAQLPPARHWRLSVGSDELEAAEWRPPTSSGPTLVLLHEGLGCIAMWRDFPARLALATGCPVFAYSRRGYGSSSPGPVPRPLDYLQQEGRDILPAVLAAAGIEQPILFGHSDGGTIALVYAASHPQGLRGAIAMAPHEWVEGEVVYTGIRAAREAWFATDLAQRLGRYHANVERVFFDWCDTWLSPAYRDWQILDLLPHMRCPVLAIQGEGDEYATLRQIEAIAEHHADTRLLKLADCGHSPQRDQLAAVLAAVAAFVAELA